MGFKARRAIDALLLGPHRRRRAIDRRLADLDRIEFGVQPVRRRGVRREVLGLVAIVGAVVGALVVWLTGSHGAQQPTAARGAAAPAAAAAHRLLPAVTPGRSSTDYTTISRDRSLRWDPCLPIHYVVRHDGEPRRFDDMLREAITQVSRATGLKFVSDGSTTELMPYDISRRPLHQPSLYGARVVPVLVGWSNAAENPRLAGTKEGVAGPVALPVADGPATYVSGTVTYNLDGLRLLAAQPHGVGEVREVLLHELGHLVGLGHVHDATQVMYPRVTASSPSHFGAGDLAGLAAMGDGPCRSSR